jgi:hypothetical protein
MKNLWCQGELIHFLGQNTIQFQSSSDRFSFFRSPTIVSFEGSGGIELKMQATVFSQTIEFNESAGKN